MAEVSGAEELIYTMKKISLDLTAQLELNLKTEDISGVQVYFMVYILRHHRDGSYLTDMCHEIGVSKSTLSATDQKTQGKRLSIFSGRPLTISEKRKSSPRKNFFLKEVYFFRSRTDGSGNLQCARPTGNPPALQSGAKTFVTVYKDGTGAQ